jgi:hypothetical protein
METFTPPSPLRQEAGVAHRDIPWPVQQRMIINVDFKVLSKRSAALCEFRVS